jgi:hypothetical protein
MIGKVKTPERPKMPQSALDTPNIKSPDETASAYKSLISTTPTGLVRKAATVKKTLLGGIK